MIGERQKSSTIPDGQQSRCPQHSLSAAVMGEQYGTLRNKNEISGYFLTILGYKEPGHLDIVSKKKRKKKKKVEYIHASIVPWVKKKQENSFSQTRSRGEINITIVPSVKKQTKNLLILAVISIQHYR